MRWQGRVRLLGGVAAAMLLGSVGMAAAQGIDCTKARDPLDRAICASPDLIAQDSAMGAAYRAALARDPDQAANVRKAQLQWLKDRHATCLPPRTTPVASVLTVCLAQQFATRLAALAPPAAPAAAPVMPVVAAPPVPPPVAVPDVPAQTPEATLEQDHLPASAEDETLLHVTQPGRFAIIAKSASFAALELVDMITGPTPRAGEPGVADGRLDVLLDVGTYKLRSFPAKGATGDVALRVVPYRESAPAVAVPVRGSVDGTLEDFQQRSFWLAATEGQQVRVEAAGRSLADLRLWRDGVDLVAARQAIRVAEPVAGHPLRDIVLSAKLPAGTYRVTAYGGPALVWADGAVAQPLLLRGAPSEALLPGWVRGTIGPFGSEAFLAGPRDDLFHLDMAGPASLALGDAQAAIDRSSRVPAADLHVKATGAPRVVEVRGAQGTPFQLRSAAFGEPAIVRASGSYWVTANTAGFGGDAPPATLMLARQTLRKPLEMLGGQAPEIGAKSAWRRRFNLGGPVSILFHATSGGPLAAKLAGVAVQEMRLTALDSDTAVPLANADTPALWNVPAGWYALRLAPDDGVSGIADLTLGPPGLAAEIGPATPAAPITSFGIQRLGADQALVLFSNVAPDAAITMDARKLPLALKDDPLRVTQAAAQVLDVPVRLPLEGAVAALETGAGLVPVSFAPDATQADSKSRTGIAHLAAPGHDRTVALFWQPPVVTAPILAPNPQTSLEVLQDQAKSFFDLKEGEAHSMALDVREGGLYRVETLGRLHTRGSIGTHFIPRLQAVEANGVGQNMRLQGWLRAGRYHVDVAAIGSAGRLGLTAAPAPLLTGAALLPGGTARLRLPSGTGAVFPIEIADQGRYRLELLGLGRNFTARLEDEGGWPIRAAAELRTLTEDLRPGHYRLLVLPQATDARALLRLTRQDTPAPLAGHGPHPLPFDVEQSFIWREPAGRDVARDPDVWTFALAASAHVTLSISDGMTATVLHADGTAAGRLSGGVNFDGVLEAGAYRVEATSQGRNDRLDYTLSLGAEELQPDVARQVELPGSISFALAQPRVVSLTSFGAVPVRAVLHDGEGHVLDRFGERGDDWNIAVSRSLPAGRYTLDLASAAPPGAAPVAHNHNDVAAPMPDSNDDGTADDSADTSSDDQTDNTPNPEQQNATLPPGDGDDSDASSDDTPGDAQADDATRRTEILLSLPAEQAPVPAADGVMVLQGGGVHHVTLPALPALPAGRLLLAQADSATAVVLALERQDAAGAWQAVATGQGLAPLAAVPLDNATGAWRVSIRATDGGAAPIRLGVRGVDLPAESGTPRFVPSPLEDVAVAHLALGTPGLLTLAEAPPDLLIAAWPGHAATPAPAGPIASQAGDLWLISRHPGPIGLSPVAAGTVVDMVVAAGETATLPGQSGTDTLPAWIASAGQDVAGLQAGHGMGVAFGSSFALGGPIPLRLRNAGTPDDMRVTLRPVKLAMAPARAFDGRFSETVPPDTALPLTLPDGVPGLRFELSPGTAAVSGWRDAGAVTVWAGSGAVSRSLDVAEPDLLLVNTGTAAAPVTVTTLATPIGTLGPDRALKRFFGAIGGLDLPVAGKAGQHLLIAGDASAVFTGADGQVLSGTDIVLPGPGRVVLEHGPGLLASWLEGEGAAPWPAPTPRPVALPQTVALSGPAMALALSPPNPVLLQVRSSAPVILSLGGAPHLFPAGATLNRYLPGPATLGVISPHDGALAGTLTLTATPLRPAAEGLGDKVALAPGDAALFGFTLATASRIGVGVQAEPDRATVRLLDAQGQEVASGVAMLQSLAAGRYVLEVQVPPDAPATIVRPAVVGLTPRPNGPPPDVVRHYMELVGLSPEGHGQ